MSDLPIQHGWEISWEFEWEHHRTRWGSPAIHVWLPEDSDYVTVSFILSILFGEDISLHMNVW